MLAGCPSINWNRRYRLSPLVGPDAESGGRLVEWMGGQVIVLVRYKALVGLGSCWRARRVREVQRTGGRLCRLSTADSASRDWIARWFLQSLGPCCLV